LKNKASVIISYLSQIVLLIVLLQVTDLLKIITLGAMGISAILLISALAKEKKWNYKAGYGFIMFILIVAFIIGHINYVSQMTSAVLVGLIIALILGFFLTAFGIEKKPKRKAKAEVSVVDLEIPQKPEDYEVKEIKLTTPVIKKKTTTKAPAKKKEFFAAKKDGDIFHLTTCWTLKNTPRKDLKIYTSKKQPRARGLKPCKVCLN